MKIKKNKIGELTTQQLVTLIILIVSFGIILFLIFGLDLGETTDKEICHNSVILRGQSILKLGSLDCKTTYVCISGGGKCEGINPTTTIKIDLTKPNAENETMKAIADEMVDCWWMFGDGKIDYLGLDVEEATIGQMNCALCSIISFDKMIRNNENLNKEEISYNKFYRDYLKSFKKNGKSYLSYLYGTEKVEDLKLPDEYINFENKYAVLTGVAEKGALTSIKESLFGSVDLINKFFFSFARLPKAAKYGDYGPIPVVIKKKEDVNNLACDEFITKA